ncbi:MAG: DEAD/DEAH box helicase, partial [Thermoanaerobaculia bacterium]
ALGRKSDDPPLVDRRRTIAGFVATIGDAIYRSSAPRPAIAATSLHDRWIDALCSPDGTLDAKPNEAAELRRVVRRWARPVAEQAEAAFRVGFRLEEPSGQENDWRVRFLLQGSDDPSLIVAMEEVWSPPKKKRGTKSAAVAKLLSAGGSGVDGMQFLLRSLAEAGSISGKIGETLRRPEPSQFTTDSNGALEFLTRDAGSLEQAGFAVFLPSWWSPRGTKRRLALSAKARPPKFTSASGLGFGDLVEVQWGVALGDEKLSLTELRALAKMKSGLVQVRGEWVQLAGEEIAEAIRFLQKKKTAMSVQELVRMSLTGSAADATQLDVADVTAEGAARELLERLEGKREWNELPAPVGFRGELRPYQARGFSWLDFLREVSFGACLADDMGLGKTVQTLALIQKEWARKKGPVLLICPTSVTTNWVHEAARFTPSLPVLLHHGSDRTRGAGFAKKAMKSAIVVSSYALLTRDQEQLRGVKWNGVILDEAQNIKNSETRQARAARSMEGDFRIALTGTPVENNVGDLWSIMDFLNPGLLGSASSFRERFFLPIQSGRNPEAIGLLKKLTSPFILRRLKTDRSIISDLPEKNEMKVYCTLTAEQASLYQAVLDDVQEQLEPAEGIARSGLILAMLTRLKQVCNHPRQFLGDNSRIEGRSGKLARLTEMMGELIEGGDKALVFTQFSQMGEILSLHLQEEFGREVLFLHGGTPRKKRDEMVRRFQNEDGECPVFVLSLKAGGTGLNLTRANHVFHFDRWWNPAVENQATDRAFRIGQKRNVQVHKYVCGGTFEERIDAMIEGKLELATNVVGTGESWLTKLSNRELRDVFTLRAEAVGE